MIAFARPQPNEDTLPSWHKGFLAMLPAIRSYARTAFRDLDDEAKEDAVVEVVANALVAYVALYKQGRESLAYRTVLTRYAVAQFRAGRRVGTPQNQQDVLAKRAQSRRGFVVQRLSEITDDNDEWVEAVLGLLTAAADERAVVGCRARKVTERRYSYDAWLPRWRRAVGLDV